MREDERYVWNTRMTLGAFNVPYDDAETEFVLIRSLGMPKDIPLDPNDLSSRIATDLPDSEIMYRGFWHNQGLEVTCSVWALVNAMRASGVERDPEYIKTLLNYVMASVNTTDPGITINSMHAMSQGRDLPGRLTLLEYDKTLQHLPSGLPAESSQGEEIVQSNARIIEKYVTDNSSLVISRPSRRNPTGSHAVCIAGYRVNPEGFMDVQVIDSAIGVKFYGIEALSRQLAVLPRKALVVAK